MVDEDGALVEAVAAKGVVGTSLELGLLDMKTKVWKTEASGRLTSTMEKGVLGLCLR